MGMKMKGREQHTNFRLKGRRNECEQRWTEKDIYHPKSTTGHFKTHARTCNCLKIDSSVHLDIENLGFTRSKTKRICSDSEKDHEFRSDQDTIILSDLDTPTPTL